MCVCRRRPSARATKEYTADILELLCSALVHVNTVTCSRSPVLGKLRPQNTYHRSDAYVNLWSRGSDTCLNRKKRKVVILSVHFRRNMASHWNVIYVRRGMISGLSLRLRIQPLLYLNEGVSLSLQITKHLWCWPLLSIEREPALTMPIARRISIRYLGFIKRIKLHVGLYPITKIRGVVHLWQDKELPSNSYNFVWL